MTFDANNSLLGKQDQQQLATESASVTTKSEIKPKKKIIFRYIPKWENIIGLAVVHVVGGVGMFMYAYKAHFATTMLFSFFSIVYGMGVTAGSHRLWAHRTYKATLPLRIFLMICHSGMMQKDIYDWCRDHRTHHKYSETDSDPHNAKRGFFFSHVGWLLCKKHPEAVAKSETLDLTDIYNDPVVRFQIRYYIPLAAFFAFILPTLIPYYFWNESLLVSFTVNMFRYMLSLHITFSVNSFAHLYGNRPYDTGIYPVECKLVQILSVGEGYHNYHHVYPYDYSASELSWAYDINISTCFIDGCARMGLAYDLRKVEHETIQNRVERTGDLSLNELYTSRKKRAFFNPTYVALFIAFFGIPGFFYLARLVFIPMMRLFYITASLDLLLYLIG